jgi:hypothetical protein
LQRGPRLVDVEGRVREAIAEKFQIQPSDICLELQDLRAISRVRERARRPVPSDATMHPWIQT